MRECYQEGITSAGLAHLRGIQTLQLRDGQPLWQCAVDLGLPVCAKVVG